MQWALPNTRSHLRNMGSLEVSIVVLVILPESQPGFVVRTQAQKAAWGNGYRLELGVAGGWLR